MKQAILFTAFALVTAGCSSTQTTTSSDSPPLYANWPNESTNQSQAYQHRAPSTVTVVDRQPVYTESSNVYSEAPSNQVRVSQDNYDNQSSLVGPAGAVGPTGPTGPQGQTGAAGPAGYAMVGPRGAAGARGPAGPAGYAGPMGEQGAIARGEAGVAGAVGAVGAQGAIGASGVQGGSAEGIAGPAGPTGPEGSRGLVGAAGEQGPTTYGPTGPAGRAGATGLAGATGETGGAGVTTIGVAGPAGPAGPIGAQGPVGPMGMQGPAGIIPRWVTYRDFWFESGQADIHPADASLVSDIAAYLKANPSLQVGLDGTPPATGSDPRNTDLDLRRVNAVRDALLAAGVQPGQITSGSFGDPRLRRDRRVEAMLITNRQTMDSMNWAHYGQVVSVRGDRLLMVTDKKEHSHTLPRDIRVSLDGQTIGLADLKPGMWIRITTDASNSVTQIEAIDRSPAFTVATNRN